MDNRFAQSNNGLMWVNPAPDAAQGISPNYIYNMKISTSSTFSGKIQNSESTNFSKVGQFHKTFGMPVYTETEGAKTLPPERVKLRVGLIEEELEELKEAIADDDLVEIADALGDLAYVIYGAAHEYNIDLDAAVKEIHKSNMSKLDGSGNVIYRDDGKILKSDLFLPPDLSFILKAKNG